MLFFGLHVLYFWELELVHLFQHCNRMKLQMLTDGKPTNLIKTHALLSQTQKIEKGSPKENVCFLYLISSHPENFRGHGNGKTKQKQKILLPGKEVNYSDRSLT